MAEDSISCIQSNTAPHSDELHSFWVFSASTSTILAVLSSTVVRLQPFAGLRFVFGTHDVRFLVRDPAFLQDFYANLCFLFVPGIHVSK